MTTGFDMHGDGFGRRRPADPLLSLPDHPSGEWAAPMRPRPAGHPRPARFGDPYPSMFEPPQPAPAPVPEPMAAPTGAARPPRRARPLIWLLVLALLAGAGWQAYRLEQIGHDQDRIAALLDGEQTRSSALAQRAERLERQLAGVFDPAAISAAVLPSVFRVRAGGFTGTAFSVGAAADGGRANLMTNFHVVRSVFEAGRRTVSLERGSDKVAATIVKVNRDKDLALLRTDREVVGLKAAAGAEVQPGQQVVVVGAPLGLDDSVTTGVVSAYRPDDPDGPMIQFDAPINPGNSGGPVVNAADEVIGVATAKARDAEGIGLAIPIATVCDTFGVC
ncbi:S1C family serine protease [Mangrovihabitans endophyticus]|uniref:Trypsin-like peptidase domain-containing protein n=1 Tax=Mangrovihabitans endophyticus TaxID=1751298 RepID=A0A8J3C4L4_9ACTN|nr:S1C family serine protease [Mangrovihabitans endophyticus]GGL06589.1 hypothetical protein GCM10012284_46110 [Mangrovihabitans endophyticus]